MTPTQEASGAGDDVAQDMAAEVVRFVRVRSVPCPRCGYDLREIEQARCPECAEPLELRVGSPRVRFGWLVLAMAPGCFSGVAAVLLAFPVWRSIGLPPGRGAPWPVVVADLFGFVSAASVYWIYRHRHKIMRWRTGSQVGLALGVWGVHVLAFVLLLSALWIVAGPGASAATPAAPAPAQAP